MRETVVQQFKQPSGVLGRLAGFIMAHRASNRLRNAWAVSQLQVEPHHRVLEIGCGPGIALEHLAALATKGRVVGVDHSSLMVEAASTRNAEAVATGRVTVIHGTADAAAELGEFDRVLAVNVAQFWDAPVETLRTLHRMMAPNGILGIAFQPRNKGATDEDARRGAERNRSYLIEAGFRDLKIETLMLEPMATCVLGGA
ncbi:MAG: class I SAM-dependent methyltransferase [Polyangiales bacterium]